MFLNIFKLLVISRYCGGRGAMVLIVYKALYIRQLIRSRILGHPNCAIAKPCTDNIRNVLMFVLDKKINKSINQLPIFSIIYYYDKKVERVNLDNSNKPLTSNHRTKTIYDIDR